MANISLSNRLTFKERWLNGTITESITSGRVGMFYNDPVISILSLDLSGSLTADGKGRLHLPSNTQIRIPFTNQNYTGNVLLYSYDENPQEAEYIDLLYLENGYILIDLNTLPEKDGVFTFVLVPTTLSHHSFLVFSSSYAELTFSDYRTTIPFDMDCDYKENTTPVFHMCAYDKLIVTFDIEINSSKKIPIKKEFDFTTPSTLNPSQSQITSLPFFQAQQAINIQLSNPLVLNYAGVNYSFSPFSCKIIYLFPLTQRYDSSIEDPSHHVFNLYLPRSVIHNILMRALDSSIPSLIVPAILRIHGGNWTGNIADVNQVWTIDPSFESEDYIPHLLSQDFALFVIEYEGVGYGNEIPGNATIPDMLLEIQNMISFMNNNASNFHIKTDRLCLWGHSAGGHLALLYSYLSKVSNNTFGVLSPINITLVVSEAGPADLEALYTYTNEINLKNFLLQVAGVQTSSDLNQLSPGYLLSIDSSISNNLNTFIIHGTNDNVVPDSTNSILYDHITQNGTILLIQGLEHVGFTYSIDNYGDTSVEHDQEAPQHLKEALTEYMEA